MTITEARVALFPEIRQFILDTFLFGQSEDSLGDDDSFLATGIIDSTGILEVLGFLQTRYGVELTDKELVPENLDSVNRIVSFVRHKLSA